MEFIMFLPDVTSGRRKLALLSDSLKLRRGHCPKKLRVNATVNQKQIAKNTHEVVRRDKINRGSWGNGRPVGRARVEKQDAIKKAGGRHGGGGVHGERKGKGAGHEALRTEFMSVAIVRILLIDNIRSFVSFFVLLSFHRGSRISPIWVAVIQRFTFVLSHHQHFHLSSARHETGKLIYPRIFFFGYLLIKA